MGLGALAHRAHVNVNVTTTNEAGQVLGADVFTITDGLIPSWSATPYRGAMNLPGAWRAAIIAADLLGGLPWEAYESGPAGVPVVAPDQPPVLTKPAPPDARVTTLSSWALDYIWNGNAVSLKGPATPAGDVSALAPVPLGNVAIGRAGRDVGGFVRGEPTYRIGNGVYHADEVVHIKGPCEPGALRGLGALEVHLAGALRTALELQRQAGDLDISGVPTGTLKVNAPDLTADEAGVIRRNWLASQRSRTVAILNDVTDFQPLAWNPTEAQLLDARKFSLHEIALIVGIPLYFLGVPAGSETYSNVEQEGIVLTRYHMNGAIKRFEAALTDCMRPGRVVFADLNDALRADTLTRFQAWELGIRGRILTPNEARAREGLGPLPDGDELAPAAEPAAQNAAKPDTGPPEIAEGEREQGRSASSTDEAMGAPDGDDLEPAAFAAVLDVWLADEVRARGGGDPSGANLKAYWTTGAGRARWNTWTELYKHLVKHLSPSRAKRTAAQWFHDVKGYWPGDRRNRGRHSYDPSQPRDPDGKWGDGAPNVAALLAANSGGAVAPGGGGRRFREPPPQPSPPRRATPAPSVVTADSGGTVGGGDGSGGKVDAATAGDDEDEPSTTPKPGDITGRDADGRPIEVGADGSEGVRRPEIPEPNGYGGGEGTGLKRYKLNPDKFCPTCGGKAQDPQWSTTGINGYAVDGAALWEPGFTPERDDEPYHDPSDPDYEDD